MIDIKRKISLAILEGKKRAFFRCPNGVVPNLLQARIVWPKAVLVAVPSKDSSEGKAYYICFDIENFHGDVCCKDKLIIVWE